MPGSLVPLDVAVPVVVPYHFRCPISLELMGDPVTVSTGQTYDRSSIESWVGAGNKTCPVTRIPMADFTLIPNHTLRRLIQDWCVQNRSFGVERIPTPKQPAEPIVVRNLLNQASSESLPLGLRISALRRLRGLARESEKNRAVIVGVDAREILLTTVFSNGDGCDSSELNYEALAILAVISLSEEDCVCVATDSLRIGFLVSLLFHSSIDVRVNSAALIEIIVADIRSPELRAQIGGVEGLFEGIVGILNFTLASPRALKIGIKTLFALCLVKQNRHKAIVAGAAGALIHKISEFDKCDAERALATVELLCRTPSGCAGFHSLDTTVPLLVKIILKISNRTTEYATGALLSLCSAHDQSRQVAVAAGVLTKLLLLVQSDCTQRAKRKAQMLLKLLRDSWPQASVENSDDFLCSDVVPF